jgi:hypothetical protein
MSRPRGFAHLAICLLGGLAAGFAAAIATAVVLAIANLYVAGHGRPALTRPWIDWAFVHLSRADAVLLGVSSLVFAMVAVGIHRYRAGSPAS